MVVQEKKITQRKKIVQCSLLHRLSMHSSLLLTVSQNDIWYNIWITFYFSLQAMEYTFYSGVGWGTPNKNTLKKPLFFNNWNRECSFEIVSEVFASVNLKDIIFTLCSLFKINFLSHYDLSFLGLIQDTILRRPGKNHLFRVKVKYIFA